VPDRVRHILQRFLAIDTPDTDEGKRLFKWALALACLAMALRLIHWVYVQRVWEDALISVLHSENFWRGYGLTHVRPGQAPLHGFTSPLSVLIPMVGDAFHIGWGYRFLKLVSVFGGALTVFYAYAIAVHPKINLPKPAAILAMGYMALEHHQILWGMAGMETQVVTLVLIASMYYLIAGKPIALGISLGFCMLARPDFAFWTVIAGVYVLGTNWRAFPKVVGVACLVYGPWIIFTTAYYGSPIPNTVYAKGLGYYLWWDHPGLSFGEVKREVWDRVSGTYFLNTLFQSLGPSYAGHGTHYRAVIQDGGIVANTMLFLALSGSIAALIRRQFALWPIAFFTLVYSIYYIFFVPTVFGWYIVPFAAATILLCSRGLSAYASLIPQLAYSNRVMTLLVVLYLGGLATLLPLTFHTDRRVQRDVDGGQRKKMAFYLKETTAPEDWIGCEPLGYISYYGQRPVYDWPGLASRQVVQFWRDHPDAWGMYDLFAHFEPGRIVLRPHELNKMPEDDRAWFDENYEQVAEFSVPEETKKSIFLYYCNQDMTFFVFRHKDGTSPSVVPEDDSVG
jgi:hypothetical protein